MTIIDIIKKWKGKYLTAYSLVYESDSGEKKIYEMVSRDRNVQNISDLDRHVDAVVMIIHNKCGDKLLLTKEYRMTVGKNLFGFPSGLIEDGESISQCAKRELKEETGLDLEKIVTQLPKSYSAIGLCNEKSVCIIGKANGTIKGINTINEKIAARWYNKQEVKEILMTGDMSARAQMYCYMWLKIIDMEEEIVRNIL